MSLYQAYDFQFENTYKGTCNLAYTWFGLPVRNISVVKIGVKWKTISWLALEMMKPHRCERLFVMGFPKNPYRKTIHIKGDTKCQYIK